MPVATRCQSLDLYDVAVQKAARGRRRNAKSELHRNEVLKAALAVSSRRRSTHLSFRQAATHYNVSVSTIQRSIQRLRSGRDPKPGKHGAELPCLLMKKNF